MWSKLLPRGSGGDAPSLIYQKLGADRAGTLGGSAPVNPRQAPTPAANAGVQELESLRQRMAELESAHTQQMNAARQAAYREGEAAGRKEAEAAIKPIADRLQKSVQDMADLKPRIRRELEEDTVKLSLAMAKRILHRELSIDPAALQGLVQSSFQRMSRNEITRIITHPDHANTVKEALAQLSSRKVEIQAEQSRERGTLIFEFTRGTLDASVDSQLREIELGLTDRLKLR